MEIRKFIFIAVFFLQIFAVSNVFSQVSINDIKGSKIRNTEGYEGIEGSPYFNTEWLKGEVVLSSGKQAKLDYLKYDMLADRVFFSDQAKGQEFDFAEAVSAFTLRGVVFQNNFPSIGIYNKESYFQVLAKTKLVLLKKEVITINERVQYGTPSARFFKRMTKYFVDNGAQMLLLKPEAKSIAKVLGVDIKEIEKYINAKDLSLKEDIALRDVFENFSK